MLDILWQHENLQQASQKRYCGKLQQNNVPSIV